MLLGRLPLNDQDVPQDEAVTPMGWKDDDSIEVAGQMIVSAAFLFAVGLLIKARDGFFYLSLFWFIPHARCYLRRLSGGRAHSTPTCSVEGKGFGRRG
jgi:hypothetical protein